MIDIKYSNSIPEIYWKCKEKFNISWEKGIVITYGDTVYCKYKISEDLKAHEATHVSQQNEVGKKVWWERYFKDKRFRLLQEVEAYRNQIDFIRKYYNRKQRRLMEKKIVNDMNKFYGDMCTKDEAKELVLSQ